MEKTREPQYQRVLELRETRGFSRFGLMTNQIWRDDPRRLVFSLARYKFVSKMFRGRRCVLEIGCGDGLGAQIVRQEVTRLVAVDFDPVFIADARDRAEDRREIEFRCHDILDGALPERFDGAYSLDVIEHIAAQDEDRYLRHILASLTDEGALIIGMPTLQSQAFASPASREGHINCKTHEAFLALLERYFHNVFLFSMNDEVVHTGFYPMAHYLLALCAGPKRDASAA